MSKTTMNAGRMSWIAGRSTQTVPRLFRRRESIFSASLPTVTVNDAQLVVGEPGAPEDDEEAVLLEEELERLAEERRTRGAEPAGVDAEEAIDAD